MLEMFDMQTLITTAGYSGLFAIVFAESGLFFGFFLPGDSLLFTAGFLASQGLFNIWILLPLLFVAAVLGDSVGYSFGKYVGPKLFTRSKSHFFKPHHMENAHEFFLQHGTKAVFFARFLPIFRTFVPIVAGIARMPYHNFLIFNLIGACAWAVGITLLGFILGSQVPQTADYIHVIIICIILISLLPTLFGFHGKKKKVETDTIIAE